MKNWGGGDGLPKDHWVFKAAEKERARMAKKAAKPVDVGFDTDAEQKRLDRNYKKKLDGMSGLSTEDKRRMHTKYDETETTEGE